MRTNCWETVQHHDSNDVLSLQYKPLFKENLTVKHFEPSYIPSPGRCKQPFSLKGYDLLAFTTLLHCEQKEI